MKNIFGNNLKKLRLERNLSQEELANLLSTSKQVISRYETGARVPKITTVKDYSEILNVNLINLIGLDETTELKSSDNDNSEPSVSFPVIGDVAAGYGLDAIEEDTGIRVDIPQSWLRGYQPSDFFVLRVSGDSMYPDYQEGDYVLVRKQTSVDSGAVAVVLYDSDLATIKQVKYISGEDWLELIPRNPEYATKRVEGIDLEDCRVLGLVMRLLRIVKD